MKKGAVACIVTAPFSYTAGYGVFQRRLCRGNHSGL